MEEKKNFWFDYWKELQQTTRETENLIDKKVYGIAAGGIGLEIASLKNISSFSFKWLAFSSGLLFAITLVLNLSTHLRSLKSQDKEYNAIQQIIEGAKKTDDSSIYSLIMRENRILTRINKASIISMFLAIISLIAFLFFNI